MTDGQKIDVLAVMDRFIARHEISKFGDRPMTQARAAVAELMQTSHALGPLISEAVAQSKPGAMREDAIRRRDNFYAALAAMQPE